MNQADQKMSADDIEALLPWYAAGTLAAREADGREFGEVLDSLDLKLEVAASTRGEPIRPPIARAFIFFDALDPRLVEQAPQSSIKRAGAQLYAPIAHPFHILQDRIAMTWLLREAQQHQQYRFGKRQGFHMAFNDMSYSAILEVGNIVVND